MSYGQFGRENRPYRSRFGQIGISKLTPRSGIPKDPAWGSYRYLGGLGLSTVSKTGGGSFFPVQKGHRQPDSQYHGCHAAASSASSFSKLFLFSEQLLYAILHHAFYRR